MGRTPRPSRRTRLTSQKADMPTAKPVALITGGAKGIGRAIARHLFSSGWQVAIIDLADSGLHRLLPRARNRLAMKGAVRKAHPLSEPVAATIHRSHRPAAAVSNAGIRVRNPLRRLALAEWHRVLDTNLTATFLLARAA